jgi:hypothetical protein
VGARGFDASGPVGSRFTYRRLFTDLEIVVSESGFSLRDEEQKRITALLDRLPITHLSGLKHIAIRPDPRRSDQTVVGETLILRTGRLRTNGLSWLVINDLASGLGESVYKNVLSEDERRQWRELSAGAAEGGGDPADAFGLAYASHVNNSVDHLLWAAGDPARRLPRTFVDGVPEDPQPERELPRALFTASLFTNRATQAFFLYRMRNGNVTQTFGQASRSSSASEHGAETLTLGGFTIALHAGRAVGWSTVEDDDRPGPAHRFAEAFAVPEAVFSRIPLR